MNVPILRSKEVNELKQCKDKFKSWEKNFLLKNNLATATLGNIQSDKLADILYKKIKYAEALIKSWKKERDLNSRGGKV